MYISHSFIILNNNNENFLFITCKYVLNKCKRGNYLNLYNVHFLILIFIALMYNKKTKFSIINIISYFIFMMYILIDRIIKLINFPKN